MCIKNKNDDSAATTSQSLDVLMLPNKAKLKPKVGQERRSLILVNCQPFLLKFVTVLGLQVAEFPFQDGQAVQHDVLWS